MKIVIILEYGIPEYRSFLFERLSKEDAVSELIVLHNGKIYSGSGDYNSKKLRFIGNKIGGSHLGFWRYIKNADVVISSYNLRILSCWIPVLFKAKWIFWGKGLGTKKDFVTKLLRKITAKRAARILVYYSQNKEDLIAETGVDPEKVVAYNNTVRISNPGFNQSSARNNFLYFGRIQERKGLKELLYQYRNYIENEDVDKIKRLRIVGDGKYRQELKYICNKLSIIKHVDFFPGSYDDNIIKKHFDAAIAYVSPYNVGLSVVNSLAYGVPIITCTNKQIAPEFNYLNHKNSFIIDHIDKLSPILKDVSILDSKSDIYKDCYNYYINNLTHDKMYEIFYNTIIEVYKNR